jgi:hypothetical protein
VIDDARLEEALRELGGQLSVPEPPDAGLLTEKVLARLDEEPAHRSRLRNSVLLRVAAVVVVALVALAVLIAVSPPVRAGVLNLLRFAGIEISQSATPIQLPPTPAPLPDQRSVDLPTAQRLSRFPVSLPEQLGQPEQVLIIDGQPPRLVSLLYRGGTVRLDEFDGTLDYALYKKVAGSNGIDYATVDGETGIWVDRPHALTYVDRDGKYRNESARLSGKTLIWQRGDVTLRLEGDFTESDAVAIAESIR